MARCTADAQLRDYAWWLDIARGSPSHYSPPHFGWREGSRMQVLSFEHVCEITRSVGASTYKHAIICQIFLANAHRDRFAEWTTVSDDPRSLTKA